MYLTLSPSRNVDKTSANVNTSYKILIRWGKNLTKWKQGPTCWKFFCRVFVIWVDYRNAQHIFKITELDLPSVNFSNILISDKTLLNSNLVYHIFNDSLKTLLKWLFHSFLHWNYHLLLAGMYSFWKNFIMFSWITFRSVNKIITLIWDHFDF